MQVGLQPALSDANLDAQQAVSQRQLVVSIAAVAEESDPNVPLNLCLVLDHSGSMKGYPLETVKLAAQKLVDRLSERDRISVIGFDHKAKVIVANQSVENAASIKLAINQLRAGGGTAIDEGLRVGIEELVKGKQDAISQLFLLTDGENEHGDNHRCLKLAQLSTSYNLTLNTLGFGDSWNQDVLEEIADAGGGTLSHIQEPDAAVEVFSQLFRRAQSVRLTNAYLLISHIPQIRLAELKPIAQVAPETIELPLQGEGEWFKVRLGDLMTHVPKVVLVNFYIEHLPEGRHPIVKLQVRYDDPGSGVGMRSDTLTVTIDVSQDYHPSTDSQVQQYVLMLAKYRQTQIAEAKLQQGDRSGAVTMLQSAARTALQLGDKQAATIFQENATRLQAGADLSEHDRKKTRIVSKTVLQE
jgi:Ca-activated chloride channel family protein